MLFVYMICSKLNVVDTFRCSVGSVTSIPEQKVTLTDTLPAHVILLFRDDTVIPFFLFVSTPMMPYYTPVTPCTLLHLIYCTSPLSIT